MAQGMVNTPRNCSYCDHPLSLPRSASQHLHSGCSKDYWREKARIQSQQRWASMTEEEKKTNNNRFRAYRKNLRAEALSAYGGKCACCGENKNEFLAIDHIEGSGRSHRATIGSVGGSSFYLWLKRQGFPKNFRVLCHNCNMSFGLYGYCPHSADADFNAARVILKRFVLPERTDPVQLSYPLALEKG